MCIYFLLASSKVTICVMGHNEHELQACNFFFFVKYFFIQMVILRFNIFVCFNGGLTIIKYCKQVQKVELIGICFSCLPVVGISDTPTFPRTHPENWHPLDQGLILSYLDWVLYLFLNITALGSKQNIPQTDTQQLYFTVMHFSRRGSL